MNISRFKRQKGVFAIEFALGFFVLFMFTMLIFETCRVTYIAAVLDYATAEAARDARVQLKKNEEFKKYEHINCDEIKEESEKNHCKRVKKIGKDQFSQWYYQFISSNAGVLWKVFTSESNYELKVRAYLDPSHYENNLETSNWDKATIAEYTVTYTYRPIMFRWSFAESKITRKLLAIQDTALFREKLKG
ncbi:TadE/TadG family type IV pilus assembly protein [Photobacterium kagoshimensis]|uniref:TadE/TadG family type IV pilus assembly protein n=1 Tax=Photobacterium kagoshimensis TaxID=2910242 RepID=UPI003D145465